MLLQLQLRSFQLEQRQRKVVFHSEMFKVICSQNCSISMISTEVTGSINNTCMVRLYIHSAMYFIFCSLTWLQYCCSMFA